MSDSEEKETKLQPRHTCGLDLLWLSLGPRFKEGHRGWGWGMGTADQAAGTWQARGSRVKMGHSTLGP